MDYSSDSSESSVDQDRHVPVIGRSLVNCGMRKVKCGIQKCGHICGMVCKMWNAES